MFNQQGFSLLEVLLSLVLITSLAFAMLHYQLQSKLLFSQWLTHIDGLNLIQQQHETEVALQQVPATLLTT